MERRDPYRRGLSVHGSEDPGRRQIRAERRCVSALICPHGRPGCSAGREQSLLARARPYTRLGTADSVSFYSAADIHRFKSPGDPVGAGSRASARLLHLTRNGSAAPRRKGAVGHRSELAAAEIVILQGVPVTSIARTLLDLAGTGP